VNARLVVRLYRVILGLLALAAIGTQLVSLVGKPQFNPVSHFSYFTIDSNLIAAVLLLVCAARSRSNHSLRLDVLRGAAVVYMAVTGLCSRFCSAAPTSTPPYPGSTPLSTN
jgi:hypothetical protein